MANNNTFASFMVPVKDTALTAKRLEEIAVWFDYGPDDPEDKPLSVELFGDKAGAITAKLNERRVEQGNLGCDWTVEGGALYLSHDETIEIEAAVLLAQIFLDLDDNDAILTATWADVCSAPRVDEFGGGAVAFTRHASEWKSTYTLAKDLAEKLEKLRTKTTRRRAKKGGA